MIAIQVAQIIQAKFFDTLFAPTPKTVKMIKTVDIYVWDNPDNCSDREYMDDDDYGNFDS